MRYAITRAVSSAINQCELTHFSRTPIDLSLARKQHHAYEAALQSLGCQLIPLPEEPTLPDSVFVEDAAVVLDEEVPVRHRCQRDLGKPALKTVGLVAEFVRGVDRDARHHAQ